MHISDIMTKPVVVVDSTEILSKAFQVMQRHRIKHLPVVDGGELVGIVSDRDLLSQAVRENGVLQFPRITVDRVMVSPVVTCKTDMKMDEALDTLLNQHISCLVALDEKKQIAGIVTSTSFLKMMKTGESSRS